MYCMLDRFFFANYRLIILQKQGIYVLANYPNSIQPIKVFVHTILSLNNWPILFSLLFKNQFTFPHDNSYFWPWHHKVISHIVPSFAIIWEDNIDNCHIKGHNTITLYIYTSVIKRPKGDKPCRGISVKMGRTEAEKG